MYEKYEREKEKIKNLPPEEYEKAIKEIIANLKI